MEKRLFLNLIIVIVIAVGLTGLLSYMTAVSYVDKQMEADLEDKIDLFWKDYQEGESFDSLISKFSELFPNTRVTIVEGETGEVLRDSSQNPESMNSHQNRQEIDEALKHGVGTARRYSDTMFEDYKYVAKSETLDGRTYVIRMAVPVDTLNSIGFSMIMFFVYGILASLVVASIVAYRYVRKITVPLAELKDSANEIAMGCYDHEVHVKADKDIMELAQSLDKMRVKTSDALHSLKAKNDQLDAIVNTMAGGLIAIDDKNIVILINKNAIDLLDIPGRHHAGRPIEYIVRNEEFNAFLKSPESMAMIRFGGKHLRLNKSCIRETGGQVVLIHDITKMMNLENLRSEFVSNVTHELKTPLTSIIGFTDTLKNGALENPEVAMKFLDIIDIESTRLLNLINDILELSHIETIQTDENQTTFPIDQAVNSVIALLEKRAADRGVKILYDPCGIQVTANENRMKEILINLISNAIRYNKPDGTVTIIACEKDGSLELSVEDTGIGIDQEHLPRIFERFYRVDKGRSRESGGTGLGLSIVKHIAGMYQGTVSVTSKLGEGSIFKVVLPIIGGNKDDKK